MDLDGSFIDETSSSIDDEVDLTSDNDDDGDDDIADVGKTAIRSSSENGVAAAAATADDDDNDDDDDADILAPVPFLSSQQQQSSMKTLTQPTSTKFRGKILATRENMSAMADRMRSILDRKKNADNSLKQMTQEKDNKVNKQLNDQAKMTTMTKHQKRKADSSHALNETKRQKDPPADPMDNFVGVPAETTHFNFLQVSQASPSAPAQVFLSGKSFATRENMSAMADRMRSILDRKKNADNSLKQMTQEKDNGDKHKVNKQLNDQAKRTTMSKHQKRKADSSHALKDYNRQKDPPADPMDNFVGIPAETTHSNFLQVSQASPSAPAQVSISVSDNECDVFCKQAKQSKASPDESRPSTSSFQNCLSSVPSGRYIDQISSCPDDEEGPSFQKVIERDIEYQARNNSVGKVQSLDVNNYKSDNVNITAIGSASVPGVDAADNGDNDDADILAPLPLVSSQEQCKQSSMKTLAQSTSTPAKAKRTTNSKHQKMTAELSHALKETKRQKVSSSERITTSKEGECVTESTRMPQLLTDTLDTLLDETRFTIEYLQMLQGNISPSYHPEPQTLTKVMDILLNASNAGEAELAYNVLDEVIRLHPPVDLEDLWSEVIPWGLIEKCFSDIMVRREAQVVMNNRMFLRLLKSLLHFNLEHAFLHASSRQPNRHMRQRLLWYPSYIVPINERCWQLMNHFATIISQFHHGNTHWDRQTQFELTEIVSWMVAMVAECNRLTESPNSSGILGLRGNITSQWVKTLVSHLKDISSWNDLQHVLRSFKLPWLSLAVCEQLLEDLKDTLCPDKAVRKSLTLPRIVQYHMFLLPKFNLNPRPLEPSSPDTRSKRPIRVKSNQGTFDTNTTVSQIDLFKTLKKVNKRNPVGETALHTACIKNNLAELKRLLKIPGIDVNIKDNFGWTPLHEACYHGNVDCVNELLNYVPTTTLEGYFSKDNNPLYCKKLDILATNEEEITALHEAVLSKQYQVCKVLLQHGGPALLKPVTCLGYTPLDLAMDTEIYNLLCSFLTQKIHTVSESQPSVSRSQGSLICNEGDFHVPGDAMYEEVTHCEGKQIYAETQSLLMFIHLVTALVQFYIQCKNLSNIYLKIQASKPSNEPVNEKADNFSAIGVNESSKLPFNCSEMDWQPTVRIEKVNQSDVGEKLSQELENKEVDLLQKDLHVLAHLRDHIERFRSHLTKIRHKKDTQAVEGALIELTLLEESFV